MRRVGRGGTGGSLYLCFSLYCLVSDFEFIVEVENTPCGKYVRLVVTGGVDEWLSHGKGPPHGGLAFLNLPTPLAELIPKRVFIPHTAPQLQPGPRERSCDRSGAKRHAKEGLGIFMRTPTNHDAVQKEVKKSVTAPRMAKSAPAWSKIFCWYEMKITEFQQMELLQQKASR